MEDQSQQNPNSQQPPVHTGMSHERVIQPSIELVEEVKAAQQAQTDQTLPQQQPAVVPVAPQNESKPVPQQPVAPQSVYPETTASLWGGASAPAPITESDAQATEMLTRIRRKKVLVRIVVGVLIILNLINAYDWYLEQHVGYTNMPSLVELCANMGILIGIAMFKELARVIYVFLSALVIIIAVVGVLELYSHRPPAAVQSQSPAQMRTGLQHSLAYYEKIPNPTSQEKMAEQQTREELDKLPTNNSTISPVLKLKQYLSEILLLVVAVGPLIFLTRPSIKDLFS